MITCRVYRDHELDGETPFTPGIVAAAREQGHLVWLDVIDPSDDELEALRGELGLHELAVQDSRRWGQRAKIDFYPDHVFLVAHGLDMDENEELVDREVHVFAAAGRYLVTVRRDPTLGFDKAGARVSSSAPLMSEGIGFFLYLIVDEIVDGYLDLVDRIEDLGDDIEDTVAAQDDGSGGGEAQRALAHRIFRVRRQVVRSRRLVAPMRETVDLILETPSLATAALVPYYRDVLDHVIRALELADNVRDLLTSARELQLAQASNRLNVVMRQLSAWAAMILVPTLIAGIYGMNFRRLPETRWAFGYPFALGLMVVSAFVLYRMFRRRGWL